MSGSKQPPEAMNSTSSKSPATGRKRPQGAGRPMAGSRKRRATAGRPRVICLANRKGGSGKTTTTFNLAGALVGMGYQVLVLDMDPQASFSRSLCVHPNGNPFSTVLLAERSGTGELTGHVQRTALRGLYAIPADSGLGRAEVDLTPELTRHHRRLDKCLTRLASGPLLDFVLIDSPPSLGFLTVSSLTAADEVIVPTDGSSYGTEALKDTLAIIDLTRKNINPRLGVCGILLGNVNRRTLYDTAIEETLRDTFGRAVFRTVIPTSIKADEAAQMARPITFYARSSVLAKAYRSLAKEVVARGATGAGQEG